MRDLEETLIDSRLALDGRLLKVHADRVRLPDGSVHLREVVRFPRSVGILPVLPDGRVLTVRQWRHAIGRWSFELPGGKVDPGESSREAALRELREETGYAAEWLRPLTRFGLAIGYSSEMMTLYLAGGLVPAPLEGDADENLEPAALDAREIVMELEGGGVVDSKTVIGLLYWLAMWSASTDPRDPSSPLPPGAAGLEVEPGSPPRSPA